jgi:hypothetical protein
MGMTHLWKSEKELIPKDAWKSPAGKQRVFTTFPQALLEHYSKQKDKSMKMKRFR